MANQIDYKSVLQDFMSDIDTKQYTDEEIFGAYPEFNNDKALLDAAYQYANTVKANKYDEPTLRSKFPEFFAPNQPSSAQPANPRVKDNPAPTTEEEYQRNLEQQDIASGVATPITDKDKDNMMLQNAEQMRRNVAQMAQRAGQMTIPEPSLSLAPKDGSIEAASKRMQTDVHREIRKQTIAKNMLDETAQSLGDLQRADREAWFAKGKNMNPTQQAYLAQAYRQDPYLEAANSVLFNAEVRMSDAKRQNGISWKNVGEGLVSFGKDTGKHLLTKLEGMASFGMSDVRNAVYQRNVLKKVADANAFDNPETVLTPQEKALYDATITSIAVDIARQNDTSRWSKAGQITADMIPFIEDIMIGNALFKGFGDAGREAIKKGVEKHVRNKLAKWLLTNVGDVAISAGESAATAAILPHTYAEMYKNTAQADMDKIGMDGDFRMKLGGIKEQDFGKSWAQAYGNEVKELFTETGGNFRLIGRALIDNPIGKKILKTPFGMVLKRFEGAQGNAGSRFASMTMYHGVLGEWLEELEGAIYDGNLKDFFTDDTQLPMLLSFSVPAAFTGGLNAGQQALYQAKYDQAGKRIDKLIDASSYVGPDKNTIKGQILATLYQTPTENLPQAIGMCVEQVYPEEYKALMDGAPEKGNKAAELSYAIKEYLTSGTVLTIFDPDMIGGQIADVQAHRQQMRQQAEQNAQAEVQSISHEDGNIYRVGIKGKDGVSGYAFAGNLDIRQNPDGTFTTRGRDLITIKMEDGTTPQVPADEVAILEAPTSAYDRVQAVADHLFAQYANNDLFQIGDKVHIMQDGQPSAESSTIVNITDEGVEVEIIDPNGKPNTTVIPHKQAAEMLSKAEGTEDGIVTFQMRDGNTVRLRDMGDGTFASIVSKGEQPEIFTEEELAEAGAVRADQPTVEQNSATSEQNSATSEQNNSATSEHNSATSEHPAYPTDETGNPAWGQMEVPQSAQVLYDLYKGNRESAKAYADDQLKEAQRVQKAAAKQASHNLNLAQRLAEEEQNAQFKAQADAAVKYWGDVKLAIAQIKSAEELAAEQAQREKLMAAREQRSKTEAGTQANLAPQERYAAAPKYYGHEITITTPTGQELKARYVLHDAFALTPSHNPFDNFNSSEGYPTNADGQNVNDRNYKDPEEIEKVMQIANAPDGRLWTNMPIQHTGRIASHNGSHQGLMVGYRNGKAEKYRQAVAANIATTGIDAAHLSEFEYPEVSLELIEPFEFSTSNLAMFNAQETQKQSNTSMAAKFTRALTPQAISEIGRALEPFANLDSFFSSDDATNNLVNKLIETGVITQRDRAQLFDADGVSATGRDTLKNVFLGAALDADIIKLLGKDKQLRASVLCAIPQIIENAGLQEYALTEDINNAIRALYDMRNKGLSYYEYTMQLDFETGLPASVGYKRYALFIAQAMQEGGVDNFRKRLKDYNNRAKALQGGNIDLLSGGILSLDELKEQQLQEYGFNYQEPATPAAEQLGADEQSGAAGNAQVQSPVPNNDQVEPEKIVPERPNSKQLQGMSYNVAEAEDMLGRMARNILDDNGYEDVEIVGVKVIGSRVNGNAREDSDLDCLIEFKGNAREDSLFNLFEEQGIELDGVKVDINPITEGKSGTIEQFMRRSDEYLAEKAATQALYDALAQAEAETDTNPTEAQKKAENYKQGHVTLWGLPITIENPKGSIRRGTDANGKQWEQEMHHTYGKIRRTEGVDGDHIDVFIGPNLTSDKVFVVDQRNVDTGEFDEHKCMLGFDSLEDAQNGYLSNYEEGWQGMGTVTEVTMDEFKKWIDSSHRKTKPFAEYKSVKTEGAASVGYEEDEQEQEQAEPVRAKHAFEVTISDINGFIDRCANNYFKNYALNNDALDTFYDQQVGKHIIAGAPYVDGAYILEVLHTANEELDKLKGKRDKYSSIKKRVFSNLVRDIQAGLSQPVSVGENAESSNKVTKNEKNSTKNAENPQNSLKSEEKVVNLQPKTYYNHRTGEYENLPEGVEVVGKTKSGIFLKVDGDGEAILAIPRTDRDENGVFRPEFSGVTYQINVKKGQEKLAQQIANQKGYYYSPAQSGYAPARISMQAHDDILDLAVETYRAINNQPSGPAPTKPKRNQEQTTEQLGTNNSEVVSKQPRNQQQANFESNSVFTADAVAEARKRLAARRNRLNMGLNPEDAYDYTIIAGAYVEQGVRKFADFCKAMIQDLGDAVRPYLQSIYDSLRHDPQVKAQGWNKDFDSHDVVDNFDVDNFDFNERNMPEVRDYKDVNGQDIHIDDVSMSKSDGKLYYKLTVTEADGKHQRQTSVSVDTFNHELETKGIYPANEQPAEETTEPAAERTLGTIRKSKNTKTGAEIYVVSLTDHVSNDEFKVLKARARANGGYYSSFAKNRGFIFNTEEDAKRFNTINDEEVTDAQTSANTEAVISQAETVAATAETIETPEQVAPEVTPEAKEEQVTEVQQVIEQVDDAVEQINEQLAVLGYYEADTDDPSKWNESYGFIRSAEAKALKDIDRLAKQLAADLGIEVNKRKKIASANLAPAGGDISFRLPLSEDGKELYLTIDVAPNESWRVHYNPEGSEYDLVVDGLMWRVEDTKVKGFGRYLISNQIYREGPDGFKLKYQSLVDSIRRQAKDYLTKVEEASAPVEHMSDLLEEAKKRKAASDKRKKDKTRIQDGQQVLNLFDDAVEDLTEAARQVKQLNDNNNGNINESTEGAGRTTPEGVNEVGSNGIESNGGQQTGSAQEPSGRRNTGRVAGSDAGQNGGETQQPTATGTEQPRSKRGSASGTAGGVSSGNVLEDPTVEHGDRRADDGSLRTPKEKDTPKNTRNYLYPEDAGEIDNMSPMERLEANVEALEVLRTLLTEEREATPEERATLGKLRGWGGINVPDNYTAKFTPLAMNPLQKRLVAVVNALDPNGERKLLDSLRTASLTSYYTPIPIARAMHAIAEQAGYKGNGNMLDPSMGNGVFEGSMAKGVQQSTNIRGVELDWLTGQIAQKLYPDARINITGFQDAHIPQDYYDYVVSNIPFGSLQITDLDWQKNPSPIRKAAQGKIHNYFAVKMIESTRPGGLCVIMTSNAIMDTAGNDIIRKYITDNCEVLGAVRLPNNTFKGAGTRVVTDVIYLRKFRNAADREVTLNNADYVENVKTPFEQPTVQELQNKNGVGIGVRYSSYYATHKDNLIGTPIAGGQYSDEAYDQESNLSTDELAQQLETIGRRFMDERKKRFGSITVNTTTPRAEIQERIKERYKGNGRYESSGNIVVQDGKIGKLEGTKEGNMTQLMFAEQKLGSATVAQVTDYANLRSLLKQLIHVQIENYTSDRIDEVRKQMQQAYTAYTKKYGKLCEKKNAFIEEDIDGYQVRALEQWKDGKFVGMADIYTKNTIASERDMNDVSDPQAAVLNSLAEYGNINTEYLQRVLGDNFAEACKGLIFEDPSHQGEYIARDVYLSGDVVTKLEYARQMAEEDSRFQENVTALEAIQPKRKEFGEFPCHMGARWIPVQIYNDFLNDVFGLRNTYKQKTGITYVEATNEYIFNFDRSEFGGNAAKYATSRKSASDIFQAALLDKDITVKYKDDEGKEHTDQEATDAARDKVAELREAFEDWVPQKPERVQQLTDTYNSVFNRHVLPTYNGQHLNIVGLQGMKLRPHQKDAVWRIINQRGGIVDHIVGAGKSLVMQASIMEMRRMGIAKKPMILALKSTTQQIANEFRQAFPAARVLAPTEADFSTQNRKRFLAQIAVNDYDCIILSHEQYSALDHTEAIKRSFIEDQIAQLDNLLEYLYGQKDESQLTKKQIKGLEKRKENLKERLKKLELIRTDEEFVFENLGVDYLFVDECQAFKNLMFQTSYSQIAGLGNPEGSERSTKLLYGVRALQEMHQGDMGTVFLSGTTITNSLSELYNIFNYLRPNEMARMGLNTFDAWASTFAVRSTEAEFGTTNELKEKSRFRKFEGIQELSRLYTEIADVRNDNNLELPKPKLHTVFVKIPISDTMRRINDAIVELVKNHNLTFFNIPKPAREDKYPWSLIATNLAKLATLSPKLIDPSYDDEQGKIAHVCENIKRIYKQFDKQKGVQLVFCDSGVPGPGKKYDAYNDIIRRLTKDYGIPRSEIADIHEAGDDAKRQALFKKVNDGKVRILIGGTKNMGTGVNVQQRVVAMHHLDIPWTPADVNQRNGRGSRQGNEIARDYNNNQVDAYYYAVERTLDTYRYQLQDVKGKMIDSFKMANVGVNEFDEGGGDDNMSPAEMVATLSGNPVILDKAKQDKLVDKLKRLQRSSVTEYSRRKSDYDQLVASKKWYEGLLLQNERDLETLRNNGFVKNDKGEWPPLTVTFLPSQYASDGTTYTKAKEAGIALLKEIKENGTAYLYAYGMRAKVIPHESHGEVKIGEYDLVAVSSSGLQYNEWISQDEVRAGQTMQNLLKEVYHYKEVYEHWLESVKHNMEGADPGEYSFPRQAELDAALAKKREIDAEYNKLIVSDKKPKKTEETPEAQITNLDYPQFRNQTEAQQLATAALVEVLNDNTDLDVFLATDEEAQEIQTNTGEIQTNTPEFGFRTDRDGNPIGDGDWHMNYFVREFPEYPQISSRVDKSVTTESVYVTYTNADNGRSVKVRFSGHRSNAERFGDVLTGGAPRGEILYRLGLATKEWQPFGYVPIGTISNKQIAEGNYEVADKTRAELERLPKGTDISEYKGKLVPGEPNRIYTGTFVGESQSAGIYIYKDANGNEIRGGLREAMLTPNGTLYGWAIGDRIYLTKDGLNPNSPIHEYTHLWAKAMMRNNREGWQSIVDIFKGMPFWDEVVNDPNYHGLTTDDAICSEVLARYSDQRGAARMEEWAKEEQYEAEQSGSLLRGAKVRQLINRAKQALADFWHWVGVNLFGIKHFDSAKQVADRVLWDMLNGTELDVTADREMQHIKERAIADGTFMKAPNGQHTNLNERQWLQVRTRAFKRWFGDWENDPKNASKVVDANGEPMVVYHGTAKDFTVFGEGKKGWRTSKLRTFYFTPDYHMAMIHSGYSRPGDNGIRRHKIMPSFLNARNIKVVENAVIEDVGYWATDSQLDEFELTYDGLLSQDGKQYVMLHPNQIKSATNNNGDFSEENDNIEMMISGYTQEKQRIINEWYAAHPRPQYQRGETLDHYRQRLEAYQEEEKRFREQLKAWQPSTAAQQPSVARSNGHEQRNNESFSSAKPAFVPGVRPTPESGENPREFAQRMQAYNNAMRDDKLIAEYNAEINEQASFANTLKRKFVDAARPIEQFQKWMMERGAKITSESNAYQYTFLATGRVSYSSDEFLEGTVHPLARQIAKIIDPVVGQKKGRLDDLDIVWHNMDVPGTGFQLDGKKLTPREIVGVYCQAKDCAEAAEKGLPDRGAAGFRKNLGMSYDDIIKAVEARIPRSELDELWRLINAATHFALTYDYESGRITKETYTEFYQREFYVPQRGWRERDESGLITAYESVGRRADDPYNAALVKARGRNTLAADPFPYIMSIGNSSIISSENNKIKQQFLRFCLDNEELGLQTGAFRIKKYWIMNVIDPETKRVKIDEEGKPVVEVTYSAPSEEDYEHDRKIREKIKAKRKERSKVNNAYLVRQAHDDLGPQLEAAYKAKLNQIDQAIEDLEQQMHIAWSATNTNITQRTRAEKQEHEIRVLLDGQEYLIEVQDEKLANAINKKFKEHQEEMFKSFIQSKYPTTKVGKVFEFFLTTPLRARNLTRYMSAMLTQYNPEFAASNFARDYQVALATLAAEHPELLAGFNANWVICQKAVWVYAFNDKVRGQKAFVDSDMGQYLKEYFSSGAATGFSYMQDLKTLRKEFDDMVTEGNWRKGVKASVNTLSMLTEVSETAVRFAAYVAARKKGWAINDAAFMSKELTTNFDRAGEYADKWWFTSFSFLRATINGNVKFLKAFKKMPVAYAIIGASYFVLGILNQAINPDDPDDEIWASEYTRESNFVLGKIRIPVAHFMRMYFAAGVNFTQWVQGNKSFGEAVYKTADFAANEMLPNYLNPMNGTEWDSDIQRMDYSFDGLLQGVMPTIVSPVSDVYFNRNFRGATINRRPFTLAQEGTKDILLSKENTLPVYKWLTQTIYEGVGGNMNAKYQSDDPAWRSWLFDTSASSVEHVVEGYMPAGMDMFITLGEAIYDAATGTPTGPDKWPFVRKFYNAYTPERAYMQQYYLLNGRVKEFKRNMDDYRKNDRTKYNILTHSQEYRNYQEAERLVKKQKENPTTADVQALINANKQWIK